MFEDFAGLGKVVPGCVYLISEIVAPFCKIQSHIALCGCQSIMRNVTSEKCDPALQNQKVHVAAGAIFYLKALERIFHSDE